MATESTPASGSTTVTSLQNGGDEEAEIRQEEDDKEVILEGEELFMTTTEEEQQLWLSRIQEKKMHIRKRKEQFEQWHDGMNRRRLFASHRLRKIRESFKQRSDFYSELSKQLSLARQPGFLTAPTRQLKSGPPFITNTSRNPS